MIPLRIATSSLRVFPGRSILRGMKPLLIALWIVGLISGCATLQDVANHLYGNDSVGKNGVATRPAAKVYELPSGGGEPRLKKNLIKIVRVAPKDKGPSLNLGDLLKVSEENRVIGTYELKRGERNVRLALLEDGVAQYHFNGEKQEEELKWSVIGKEAYIEYENNNIEVLRINPDSTLTHIAYIDNGKRLETSEEEQSTYQKTK